MRLAKKSLGQNFLIDKNIIKKIIKLVKIQDRDIIEIGPGTGALTDEILKNKPRSLTIIEKDTNLFENLQFPADLLGSHFCFPKSYKNQILAAGRFFFIF